MLICYEVRTLADGKWRIEAILDDKERAIEQAKRLEAIGRHQAVRVTRETVHEHDGVTISNTVYRGAAEGLERVQRPTAARFAAASGGVPHPRAARSALGPSSRRDRGLPLQLALCIAAITVGAGTVVLLRYLALGG